MQAARADRMVADARRIRWLTYLMFFMFAMTTDSVGLVIPAVIFEFRLSLTAAGALHDGSMLGIAAAGLGLGFLADAALELVLGGRGGTQRLRLECFSRDV